MKIDTKQFRVRPGGKSTSRKWQTIGKPICDSKEDYKKSATEITVSSERASAPSLTRPNRYALLLVFSGMDAAGKDGAIRHVMSGSIRTAAMFPA